MGSISPVAHLHEFGLLNAYAFNIDGRVLGNLEAGISGETNDEIFDIVEEEIIPEFDEICEKYDKQMPQEFRYIYKH